MQSSIYFNIACDYFINYISAFVTIAFTLRYNETNKLIQSIFNPIPIDGAKM